MSEGEHVMPVHMREARKEDLLAIVTLFSYPDIPGRKKNEDLGPPLPRAYEAAFEATSPLIGRF